MPRPFKRTRSLKRVCKALPGGRVTTHYKRCSKDKSSCSVCGRLQAGVPQTSTSEKGRLNRVKKRISRLYGGQLCHSCLKSALKQAAKALSANI
ncbi:MAG: 50S ribosomal protein L34e [Candidatus Bathyarchaeia archaeon]